MPSVLVSPIKNLKSLTFDVIQGNDDTIIGATGRERRR